MLTLTRQRRWVCATAVVVSGASLGCSGQQPDPRWQQSNAVRSARIERILQSSREREAESGERIAAVRDLAEAGSVRSEKNLQRTLATIDKSVRGRQERWPQVWALTRERFAQEMAGDPQNIDDTIPRMFY